ncbi:C10 family peptidase [Capnocytophaga stomatis]|uniref:C10 family peptidase n=1 Tax=Capnocytophaga stomatis TaxID=1848904 RepID=A0ABW8QAW3_9FLAO|nr:C10 family peptidase [Capnocytophaga stomatis]GIJ93547.1 hypothetical protein CAPN002_07650 [Capnocytophaga stomatis]GIM50943.1 hypothetical protein CAPN003_23950 [Capnocytophaga stomatis]
MALNFVTGVNVNSKNETIFSKKGSFRIEEFVGKDIDEIIVIPDQNNIPSLYVVTFKPVGYVIISATTKESPVLGFSVNSVFSLEDNLPEGFANWILGRLDLIQRLKYSEGIEVPSSIQDEWNAYMPREEDQISVYAGRKIIEKKPLLETKWGQYNNKFLADISCDGVMKKPPTGCVATAMAQIMKYHKFPRDRYDWDNMSTTDNFWYQ